MEIKIQAKDFQEALDIAFRDYGLVTTDILDFDEAVEGEFTFKVAKTIDSEVKLNAEVKSLIDSNHFTTNDIAFVCSDSKVHTPEGGNLFERVKSLLRDGLVPVIGFANFIEASNEWANLQGSIEGQPVVYEDLILTKEGSLLKGSKFKSIRKSNSKISDPIFDLEVDCNNPSMLKDLIDKVLGKVGLGEYADFRVDGTKCIFSPTPMVPMEVLNLLLMCMSDMPRIKRMKISNGTYTLRGDMK